ncbi:uncharacterized protein Gasu_09070 [Galdieria sulphuraria]|uniref:LITAF domain-containing protein n=1 Tax=Galdieria sulphuraria TaxID=130081 RepID=M2Y733_GALSU|nr:uncharacterized protein Gasu_09070 [Galdieria sulphuraria]EME31833.1 hypothetical protein Gasu_09070 [Galdieria sulphuraria]|eukprot:XP_005708353.1 hypothetical protein Gasu_09070 [Galdieria sulphuraria]
MNIASDIHSFSSPSEQDHPFAYPSAPHSEYTNYQFPVANQTMNSMQQAAIPANQAQAPATPPTVYVMPPFQGNNVNAQQASIQQTRKVAAVSSSNLKFGKTPQTSICPNCGEQVVTRVIFKNCTGCNWCIFIALSCIPCLLMSSSGCKCGSIAYHSCSNCSYNLGRGGAPC